ncbi:hypothetical protein Tco_1199568 [Tanacetum coccineum]
MIIICSKRNTRTYKNGQSGKRQKCYTNVYFISLSHFSLITSLHHIVIFMEQPQQIILGDQLITTKYQSIGRCNNYVVLLNISCPKECKILGHLLVVHALSYALTATIDDPIVYLQQFWKIVRLVVNANETIRFMVDRQEITYTVDMFYATLKLSMGTPSHPFITLATL